MSRFPHRVCVLCGAPSTGHAFTPSHTADTAWFCTLCFPHARKIHAMTDEAYSQLNRDAAVAGGERGGAFLDEIEVTDMAQLTVEQWDAFIDSILLGYREAVRDGVELATDGVPF